MGAVFESPFSLIVTDTKFVWVNRFEITTQLIEARTYLISGDYYDAGKSFGEAIAVATFGS